MSVFICIGAQTRGGVGDVTAHGLWFSFSLFMFSLLILDIKCEKIDVRWYRRNKKILLTPRRKWLNW